ncbi:hypothetical protein G4O51_00535 [Candidatus Bathyarchaeota archaeon A05DMB-2]|jgi:hypothetical protein|nr:hypothetical protein [Candidatus Bathyarchaeota archaeon A05DMB-2]
MPSRSAVTKLKAILIIDLIIVAAAAGTYLYLQNQGLIATAAREAEFVVTDLTITPSEAEEAEPVQITANITNIGDLEGTYDANLTINGVLTQNQTLVVPGNNTSVIAEFTVIEETIGTYTVELGGLTGSFTIKPAPPTSSNIRLSNPVVKPYESWVGDPVTVTVTANNPSGETDTLTIKFWVDEEFVESRKIELAAGETIEVAFTVNATSEGKHFFKVNSLTGTFTVVKTGYHTLTVNRSGGGSTPLPFTLNGESHNTPYTALLPVGKYTISVPTPFTTATAVLEFAYWSNGDRTPTITIDLQDRTIIVVTYNLISGYASCPSLFYWNGTDYVYVTEVANAGWLGYMDYINENGDIVYSGGNPWDYIKLDNTQLTPKNGYYDLVLFQQWDEIFYLDAAYMVVVDHPANVDVYSTMSNYINQAFNGQIYTVSKNTLLTPVSAINEKGEDVRSQISKLDGVFTPGNNGLESPAWNNITLNQLTLDLGDLSNAQQIKLVINGMVDWGDPGPYYTWVDGILTAFEQGLAPSGTQIYPAPYMEIKDANGEWARVPQSRQMPTPSDYVPRSFVVDLTGLFPDGITDYQIRITNFFNVTFDYIAVDITPQEDIAVYRINAIATLQPVEFGITTSTASGSFTRYGDVTPLLLEGDDMYVIGRQGDQVSLQFPTANLPPLAEGMERDYFLFVACWFKDPPGNWGYGFTFTTDPLPFINMSGFPYPATESYPYDAVHLQYIQEYNTRIINPK